MAVTTLYKSNFLFAPFIVPMSKNVTIDVEAEDLIDLYVLLNEQELNDFKTGTRPFNRAALGIRNYYGKVNLSSLTQIQPPPILGQPTFPPLLGLFGSSSILPGSRWFLIISNRSSEKNIAVFYRVYNA